MGDNPILVGLCRPKYLVFPYRVQTLRPLQQKDFYTDPFRNRIILFPGPYVHLALKLKILSYTPVVPPNTKSRKWAKWVNSKPVFRPKQHKNQEPINRPDKTHTIWSGTYLYGLYKGVHLLASGAFENQCMTRFELKLAYVTWWGYAMVSSTLIFLVKAVLILLLKIFSVIYLFPIFFNLHL